MRDLNDIPDEHLLYTTRTFKHLAQERGWGPIHKCGDDLTFLLATRPDGHEIRLYSATPPTTSAFALLVANDKFATYELLAAAGLRQPETVLLRTSAPATLDDNSQAALDTLLERHGQIVLKPLDEGHGHGITTGITRPEQIPAALQKAARFQHDVGTHLLAQQHIASHEHEIRVICIDYQVVIACERIPAQVTGDGQHPLDELIERENATKRTPAYQSDLALIDPEAARTYLGPRIHEIPPAGQKVRVVGPCNVGMGGEMRDVTATLTPELQQTAIDACRALRLPVAGVDFFASYIIEVNPCPALYHPIPGPAKTLAVEKYIEYLEQLPPEKFT